MLPLRIVETEREDFDGIVVELWRDDEFIGMVFWDGETPILQVYPGEAGEVHDLDLRQLLQILETADQIVDPYGFDDDIADLRDVAAAGVGWDEEDPVTLELVAEFDEQAAHRGEDGEGFFQRAVAETFVRRCDDLGLAVVEMEGFDLSAGELAARPGLELVVKPESVMGWPEFRSYANTRALDTLDGWPRRDSLVIAFVVQQPDGDSFVA